MSKFKTKEEYLNYLAGWKAATNAEECKSKRVVCDHVQYNWDYHGYTDEEKARFEEKGYKVSRNGFSYTIPNGGHRKEHGWLDATHYLFNNVMRGKDPKCGFAPKTKRKLNPGETPWYTFQRTVLELEMVVKDAEAYIEKVSRGKGCKIIGGKMAKEFLKPFDGKVRISDLIKIDREELANARKFHR